MKKIMFVLSLLFLLNIRPTFAATGAAYDGVLFLLSVGGILLIIAAIFWSIDLLKKNGKRILTGVSHLFQKLFSPRRRKDTMADGQEEHLSELVIS